MTASGRLVKPLHGLTVIPRLPLARSVHDATVVLGVGCFRIQQRRVPSRPCPPMHGKGLPFRLGAAVCFRWVLGACRDASACDQNKGTQSYAAQVPPPQGSPPLSFVSRCPFRHPQLETHHDVGIPWRLYTYASMQRISSAHILRVSPCSASIGPTVKLFQGRRGATQIRTHPYTATRVREIYNTRARDGVETPRQRPVDRAPEGALRHARRKGPWRYPGR